MSFVFIMGPSELHFTAETVYKKDIPEPSLKEGKNSQESHVRI